MTAPPDAVSSYAEVVAAVDRLARHLSPEQLATTVPGTPDWTVHDLLAHFAGCSADQATDRMDGVATPAWTARHVGERADRSVDVLMAELTGNVPTIQGQLAEKPVPAALWDVSSHLADLHEALGLGRPDATLWEPTLVGARASLGDQADAVAGVDDYELFRAIFSRRSRAQMQAWGTSLSDEELDAIPVFGPRDDDQPVPPA